MPQNDNSSQRLRVSNAELFPHIFAQLSKGHTVTLTLRGYSMRPFLEDGRDRAILASPGEIRVGQPILAEVAEGRYVLHRIIEIKGDEVTLLGDGNISPEHCKRQDIRAEVLGFYRKGRDTVDSINGLKWRCYSFVWMSLRPVRRYLLFIARHTMFRNNKNR